MQDLSRLSLDPAVKANQHARFHWRGLQAEQSRLCFRIVSVAGTLEMTSSLFLSVG